MKTEKELISEITSNLYELEIEAYGNRRHGNKELPPNLHNFHKVFKNLYEAVYGLDANVHLVIPLYIPGIINERRTDATVHTDMRQQISTLKKLLLK